MDMGRRRAEPILTHKANEHNHVLERCGRRRGEREGGGREGGREREKERERERERAGGRIEYHRTRTMSYVYVLG